MVNSLLYEPNKKSTNFTFSVTVGNTGYLGIRRKGSTNDQNFIKEKLELAFVI